jgi:hypothetical protein
MNNRRLVSQVGAATSRIVAPPMRQAVLLKRYRPLRSAFAVTHCNHRTVLPGCAGRGVAPFARSAWLTT